MARGSINKVIIIGTLGRDPEMRYLPNGNAVCNMSLATDEGYKDTNTGQQVDKTEWHRIEAFGRLAEIMGEYLKKGAKCYVEGKLKTDEYEKDGIKRYSTKIVAHERTMLDSRGPQEAEQNNSQPTGQPVEQPQAPLEGYFYTNGLPMDPATAERFIKAGIGKWKQGEVQAILPNGF